MLALTSDFRIATGNPEPALRAIAEAGFSHVMWCHQWDTDFLYSCWEMRQLRRWLRQFGLQVVDVHASAGREKQFNSLLEYERRAGVELMKNRIALAAYLESDVVVIHIPEGLPTTADPRWAQTFRSLDVLLPFARRHEVRIAIENNPRTGLIDLQEVLRRYPTPDMGLCYDAGHGNLEKCALEKLDALKDRILAVHLHDNDGTSDLHQLPFQGTVPWVRVMGLLAASSYRKCVSLEVVIQNTGFTDDQAFLTKARETGERLTAMLAAPQAVSVGRED